MLPDFGGVGEQEGSEMSWLTLTGSVCDMHVSTASPSCARVGTGPRSQISDPILRFSQGLHSGLIWRVPKFCGFSMGHPEVE